MKRFLKWAALLVVVAAVGGFLAFLYYIPPFLTTPPEQFQQAMAQAPPTVDGITDPATRAIAARGRYIVMTIGCIGCHVGNGDQGPDLTKYLAGGGLKSLHHEGTYVSANLTPDRETGLGRRSDEEVKRVLRSGTFPDGHVTPHTAMPWANFSNWSEEDLHAVVVYLRHLPQVRREIPAPVPGPAATTPGAIATDYAFKNYDVDSSRK
jgi:mono/diheme cytochrome c family protein